MTDTPKTMRLDHGQWRALLSEGCERLWNTLKGVAVPTEADVAAIQSHLDGMKSIVSQWYGSIPPELTAPLVPPSDVAPIESAPETTNGTGEPAPKRKRGRPRKDQMVPATQ